MHNYAVREQPGGAVVYQFNTDWTNPQQLDFGLPIGDNGVGTGIAFDSRTDSFWFVAGNLVVNFSRAATLLNFFFIPVNVGRLASLALDPADNTLWLWFFQSFGGPLLQQYSTAPKKEGTPRAPLSSDQIGVLRMVPNSRCAPMGLRALRSLNQRH